MLLLRYPVHDFDCVEHVRQAIPKAGRYQNERFVRDRHNHLSVLTEHVLQRIKRLGIAALNGDRVGVFLAASWSALISSRSFFVSSSFN